MIRKHRDEMLRFAHSKEGTEVWNKSRNEKEWIKVQRPMWHDSHSYIVDDGMAEVRKAVADGKQIQKRDSISGEWIDVKVSPSYSIDVSKWRVKSDEKVYYEWKKAVNGVLYVTILVTNKEALRNKYEEDGYVKIESSRTTYEELV